MQTYYVREDPETIFTNGKHAMEYARALATALNATTRVMRKHDHGETIQAWVAPRETVGELITTVMDNSDMD